VIGKAFCSLPWTLRRFQLQLISSLLLIRRRLTLSQGIGSRADKYRSVRAGHLETLKRIVTKGFGC